MAKKQPARIVEYVKSNGFGKVELADGTRLPFDRDVCRDTVFEGDDVKVEIGPARFGGGMKVTVLRLVRAPRPTLDVAFTGASAVPTGDRDTRARLTVKEVGHIDVGDAGVCVFDLIGGDLPDEIVDVSAGRYTVTYAIADHDLAYIGLRPEAGLGPDPKWKKMKRSVGSDTASAVIVDVAFIRALDTDVYIELGRSLEAPRERDENAVIGREKGLLLPSMELGTLHVASIGGKAHALVLDLGVIER